MSGDVLQITVFQVQDFNREAQVDAAGNVVLPLVGAVPVAGKTVREVESDIARRLKAKYLQDPQVLVSVKDAQSIIGRSRWTVYNLIARGEIEAVKAGSSTLVKTDSLRRYVDGLAPAKVKPLLQKAQRERARREAVA